MCIALSAFDAAPKIKRIERKEMLNVNCCYGQRETYIVGVKKGCPYSSLVNRVTRCSSYSIFKKIKIIIKIFITTKKTVNIIK